MAPGRRSVGLLERVHPKVGVGIDVHHLVDDDDLLEGDGPPRPQEGEHLVAPPNRLLHREGNRTAHEVEVESAHRYVIGSRAGVLFMLKWGMPCLLQFLSAVLCWTFL